MIFNESKDVPGNIVLEQALRGEMQKAGAGRIEFLTEYLDVAIFRTRSIFSCFRITSARNTPAKSWI